MLVAINVPDMDKLPTTCLDCPLVHRGECDDWCNVNYEDVGDFTYYQTKPDWCSMRDVGKLIHDLYASYYYEDESFCKLFYKSRVEALGIDISDMHF